MVLTVTANVGSVTIGDVYNGGAKLTKTTHYAVDGGAVTLKETYLKALDKGDYTITIETNKGNVDAVITVVDTTPEG